MIEVSSNVFASIFRYSATACAGHIVENIKHVHEPGAEAIISWHRCQIVCRIPMPPLTASFVA